MKKGRFSRDSGAFCIIVDRTMHAFSSFWTDLFKGNRNVYIYVLMQNIIQNISNKYFLPVIRYIFNIVLLCVRLISRIWIYLCICISSSNKLAKSNICLTFKCAYVRSYLITGCIYWTQWVLIVCNFWAFNVGVHFVQFVNKHKG